MECRKSHKRRFISVDSDEDEEKVYKFQILLPDGTSTHLALHNPGQEMTLGEFACAVKKEAYKNERIGNGKRRKIMWDNDIFFEDLLNNNKFRKTIKFNCLREDKLNRLRLYDGGEKTIEKFQNMWDLTPDTDLLAELPAEYTFESALADLIDNSLQAVWSNGPSERRLISVSIDEHKLLIFDTGPGMDGSDENCIIKWGKMGSSNNRSSKGSAIGGKPPYLKPFFGMFGYGGSIASMHLGRYAIVSSKTRESQKVFILHLAREHLLEKSDSWRTDGGIRDPREKEINEAPHGSFTEVEIQEPKLKVSNTFQLQCRLKDIYFPYIQCDEMRTTLKTNTPVEFLVNGVNLAEIEGGEVAKTNLHSCNGPEFVLQLRFFVSTSESSGARLREANARLKCIYLPIVRGKESIDKILEELKDKSCDIAENYENFSRVSIRRLGRLLPDARWRRLPFMELRQRKGDRGQVLMRCGLRVKCLVDTDAGFSPTPSKTDLAHHDPLTISLKNFGNKLSGKQSDVDVEIRKGGKLLTPSHLEKEYQDWIFQMHEKYDEEIGCGEDEPVVVLNPRNKRGLCISADVVRVHRTIRRNGRSWKSGEKIKFLKGSPGCHKNVLYATLEYILLEGFQGDVGGEARLICRPLGCLEEEGCLLTVDDGNACLDIRKSLSFPISVIDHGKCHVIDLNTWNDQLDKQQRKAPSTIDILGEQQCQQLEIDGALPTDNYVSAGHAPPELVVGVIRPGTFDASSSSSSLDQKFIVKDDLEMTMEIRRTHDGKQCHADEVIHGERVKPSSYKGLQGLYIFSLGRKHPRLFCKSGAYVFSFSVICKGSTYRRDIRVIVRPTLTASSWGFICDDREAENSPVNIRVGSSLSCLRIACYDVYSNRIPFSSTQATINIEVEGKMIVHVEQMEKRLSPDKMAFEFKDIMVKTSQLDMIRPNYRGTLTISSRDKRLSATVPCQVFPGTLCTVRMRPLRCFLIPGDVIDELILEMFDSCNNHVEEGEEVSLKLEGFHLLDQIGSTRKVDRHGLVNLSGLLRVEAGYGAKVELSIYTAEKMVFKEEFQTAERELKVVSGVPNCCVAGSSLCDIVFEVIDPEGVVDQNIHGQHNTLKLSSETLILSDTVQYSFCEGRCIVPSIPVPQEPGIFRLVAYHTHHPELKTSFEVSVLQAPKMELVSIPEPVETFYSPSSSNKDRLFQDSSPCVPDHTYNFFKIILNNNLKRLEDDLLQVGLQIQEHEDRLSMLNNHKESTRKEIFDLRARIEPQSLNQINHLTNAKHQIEKQIEEKVGTAAAVFADLSKSIQIQEPQKYFMQDVLGLVALLGTVDDDRVSRILGDYLGEDYMLAVVCMSSKTASALERYSEDGNIYYESPLHEAAATLGMTIKRRCPVIFLDDIRPYTGRLEDSNQSRKLALPRPCLPCGKPPPGFIGYAVNMINLDAHHLNTRTAAGHGLRETLYYRLFGDLQVYETRAHMKEADACIKQHGAVSLDGGIKRGNGIIFLGGCETGVRFPVVGPHTRTILSQCTLEVMKQIENKKSEMEAIEAELDKETEAHVRVMMKFRRKKQRLEESLEEMKPLCNGQLLEYNTSPKS